LSRALLYFAVDSQRARCNMIIDEAQADVLPPRLHTVPQTLFATPEALGAPLMFLIAETFIAARLPHQRLMRSHPGRAGRAVGRGHQGAVHGGRAAGATRAPHARHPRGFQEGVGHLLAGLAPLSDTMDCCSWHAQHACFSVVHTESGRCACGSPFHSTLPRGI